MAKSRNKRRRPESKEESSPQRAPEKDVQPRPHSWLKKILGLTGGLLALVSSLIGITQFLYPESSKKASLESSAQDQQQLSKKVEEIEKKLETIRQEDTRLARQRERTKDLLHQEDAQAKTEARAVAVKLINLIEQRDKISKEFQSVSLERLSLAERVGYLFNRSSNEEPGSDQSDNLKLKIEEIQKRDKALEMRARRIDTQMQANQAEIYVAIRLLSRPEGSGG